MSSFNTQLSIVILILVCLLFQQSCDAMRLMTMKWSFSKGMGTMRELGCVGSDGEYYFHSSKSASITGKGVPTTKTRVVPIFPYNNVLAPLGSDWLNIFEMKYRQLLNDVDQTNNMIGFSHYSQTQQKLSLVGTLARVKDRKLLSDGRTFVVLEGVQRFYLEEFVAEKPYIKARVKPFDDYSENPTMVSVLESKILNDVRLNVKLMETLHPEKNYTMNANVLLYRPAVQMPNIRTVSLVDENTELERSTKFSFAVMDMLQISPPTKLALLQVK